MTKTTDRHTNVSDVTQRVQRLLADIPITDVHTHTFDPAMGSLLLWGIDELLTYHYLVAEVSRARPDMDIAAFFAMPKSDQADLIWNELFVKRSPVSEACRGVITVMDRLGLNTDTDNLAEARDYFRNQNIGDYVDTVCRLSKVNDITMTNDPLDPEEYVCWEQGFDRDPRFHAALRLDSALMQWPAGADRLKKLGYNVSERLDASTFSEIRRYLTDWNRRLDARYMAISLPPTFRYPQPDASITTLIQETVLPVARETGLPVAMMIGVKKLTNPTLQLAGDSVGKAEIETVERLALDYPGVRFAITMLSRENMHELCIAARKFANILPFGCWWFLNNPSLIREITAMRLETLGLSFIPQHSDARVLDQLIYKWEHSRDIIGTVLAEKYALLPHAIDDKTIQRDLHQLFGTPIAATAGQ